VTHSGRRIAARFLLSAFPISTFPRSINHQPSTPSISHQPPRIAAFLPQNCLIKPNFGVNVPPDPLSGCPLRLVRYFLFACFVCFVVPGEIWFQVSVFISLVSSPRPLSPPACHPSGTPVARILARIKPHKTSINIDNVTVARMFYPRRISLPPHNGNRNRNPDFNLSPLALSSTC